MKKALFIVVALVLAVSVSLIGCAPPPEEEIPPEPSEIVIGRSVSSTGSNAPIHWAAGYPIMTLFEQEVDARGGIHLSQYDEAGDECWVPIEFKVYDDGSNAENLQLNTVKLIEDDKVDFMWAGTGTWAIYVQASLVCDTYDYVLITLEGGATNIKKYFIDDLPKLFVTLSFSDWYQLPILAKMIVDAHEEYYGEGQKPTVFIAYIDDQHGYEYRDVAIAEFGNQGVTIDEDDLFPMGYDFTNFDSVMTAAQGYDVFCGFTYPVHVFPLTAKFVEWDYNPCAIVMGPGACFGFYPYFSGVGAANVDGIMTFATANNDTVVEGGTVTMDWLFDSIATIMDGFEGCPGFFWNDFWGHSLYWAMCDIFITAVEEVGYVSQDKLSEVLHTYDSAADGIPTILGPTWYEIFGEGAGGGILSYKCHTGEIGQWKYNEATNTSRVEIVGYEGINSILPNYCITDAFRYPMTGNWTWLP